MDSYLEERLNKLVETLFEDTNSQEALNFFNILEEICRKKDYNELENLKSYLSNNELEIFKNLNTEQLREGADIVNDMYEFCISRNESRASSFDGSDLDDQINELGEILFDNNINDKILEFLNTVKELIKNGEEFKLAALKRQMKNREIDLFVNIEDSKLERAKEFINDISKDYFNKLNSFSDNKGLPEGEATPPATDNEEPTIDSPTIDLPPVSENDLLEIQKVEKLIEQLKKHGLSEEEINKLINERKTIIEKIAKLERDVQLNYSSYKDYEWDYRLNQEAIDELYAEGLVPGTPEYETALRMNYGIIGEIIPRKKNKTSDFNWDPRLNQEAIDELYAEGLVPGTPGYETALRMNYGLVPLEKELEFLHGRKNEIDQLLTPVEQLQELVEIRDAYYEILEDIYNVLKDQEMSEIDLDAKIMESINGHEKSIILQKWNNPNKMKTELKDAIKERLLTKTKADPENNLADVPTDELEQKKDKLWLKALMGTAGFASGIGVSIAVANVPVLGTALTIYAGARVAYNAIKLGCNIATKINHGNEPAVITKIKDKIPEKVKKAVSLIFDKPKNPYFKWFVNGASIGYLVGNVFDASDKFSQWRQNRGGVDKNITGGTSTSNTVPSTTHSTTHSTVSNSVPVSDLNPIPGQTYDLSSLSHGYISSTANTPTHLITSAGKNASFDKSTFVNGVEWWHFKQANGQGYAWFKAEDVEKLIGNVVKSTSTGRSL